MDDQIDGIVGTHASRIDRKVIQQQVVPICVVMVLEIQLTPAVMLLYQFARLFLSDVLPLLDHTRAFINRRNDLHVKCVGMLTENHLTGASHHHGRTRVSVVLHESCDE